ncbi:MAG: hypothetical protein ACLFQF_00350 [Rhodosalinus sp.]
MARSLALRDSQSGRCGTLARAAAQGAGEAVAVSVERSSPLDGAAAVHGPGGVD